MADVVLLNVDEIKSLPHRRHERNGESFPGTAE